MKKLLRKIKEDTSAILFSIAEGTEKKRIIKTYHNGFKTAYVEAYQFKRDEFKYDELKAIDAWVNEGSHLLKHQLSLITNKDDDAHIEITHLSIGNHSTVRNGYFIIIDNNGKLTVDSASNFFENFKEAR